MDFAASLGQSAVLIVIIHLIIEWRIVQSLHHGIGRGTQCFQHALSGWQVSFR
ncbi:hypothetical protein BH18GEM1_BH18GEM1_13630 [soil metagenome]